MTRRRPYELVLTDDLTATATFEPLSPVANETIALPDGLRITAGRGYIDVQRPEGSMGNTGSTQSSNAQASAVSSAQPVILYTLSGRLLRQAAFDGNQAAPLRFDNLAGGTYLVVCGGFRQMVVVK
ncbi:MAG: hypothetical protein LUD46_07520 [Parabacteroides sp.]|nr:hypothetical protein [Parabacteroides sp.]